MMPPGSKWPTFRKAVEEEGITVEHGKGHAIPSQRTSRSLVAATNRHRQRCKTGS